MRNNRRKRKKRINRLPIIEICMIVQTVILTIHEIEFMIEYFH